MAYNKLTKTKKGEIGEEKSHEHDHYFRLNQGTVHKEFVLAAK
jgi:hypothetical protein